MRRFASILAVLVVPGAVLACSYAPQSTVDGLLGYSSYESDSALVVPANVASVSPLVSGPEGNGEFETPVGPLYRLPDRREGLVLLPWVSLTRTEVDDVVPPSTPVVEDAVLAVSQGARGTSCSDTVARFEFSVSASDDVAPAESLTHAIYLRSSPTLAPVGRPDAFVVGDVDTDGGVWIWADPADRGSEQWVWLRTVDQAGNVSELSEPFPVDTGSAGCSAVGHGSPSALPLLGLLLLGRRRAR